MTKRQRNREKLEGDYAMAAPIGWPVSLHPLTLARWDCVFCNGKGIKPVRKGHEICPCVYRSIFRICLARYRRDRAYARMGVALEVGGGCPNFTRPASEYAADFERLAMRRLSGWDVHQAIFQRHYLEGRDYRSAYVAAQRVDPGLSLGMFWHSAYQLAEWVGERLVTIQPYRLYPLDEYFGTPAAVSIKQVSGGRVESMPALPHFSPDYKPLHFPTRKPITQRSLPLAA